MYSNESREIKDKKYVFMLNAVKQLYNIYKGKHLTPDQSKELQLTLYMAIFSRHQDNKASREPFEAMDASTKKGIVDNCLSKIQVLTKNGKVVYLNDAKDEELDFNTVEKILENISNIDMETHYDFKSNSRTVRELKENYTQQVFRYTRNSIAHAKFYIDYENGEKIHFLKEDGSKSNTKYDFSCLLETCDKMENALASQKGSKALTEYHQLLQCLKNNKTIEPDFFKNNKGKNLYFNLFTKLIFAYNSFGNLSEYERFRSKFNLEKPMKTLKLQKSKKTNDTRSEIEYEYDRVKHMRNSVTHHYHSSKRDFIRVRDFVVNHQNQKREITAEFDLRFESILNLSKHIAMFNPTMFQKNSATSFENRE